MTLSKILTISYLLLPLLTSPTLAAETYYCDKLYGVTTPLSEKSKFWNWTKSIHHGVEKTETLSDFRIIIDAQNSYIQYGNRGDKSPLLLFSNSEEKAELLEIGTIASSIWTIDKTNKQIYQAKNGIPPQSIKSSSGLKQNYQQLMSGNCKYDVEKSEKVR